MSEFSKKIKIIFVNEKNNDIIYEKSYNENNILENMDEIKKKAFRI